MSTDHVSTTMLSAPANVLLTYVRIHDYVTYPEIERVLSSHMSVKGDRCIEHPTIHNLLFWAGVSQELIAIVNELFEAGLIWRVPASSLSYMIDGGMLRYPIPKRVRKQGYAKPHWVPTCLRPIECVSNTDLEKYGTTRHREVNR